MYADYPTSKVLVLDGSSMPAAVTLPVTARLPAAFTAPHVTEPALTMLR